MSYKRTYRFEAEEDIGEAIAGGHLAKLDIVFTVDADGTNELIDCRSNGIEIKSWGELDVASSSGSSSEDYVVIAGELSMVILDAGKNIDTFLFKSTNHDVVKKNAEVSLKIKYLRNGELDEDYTDEYTGDISIETISYSVADRLFSFTAIPATNLIKETFLYKKDASGNLLVNNPLDLTYTITNTSEGQRFDWNSVSFLSLMDAIWKIVDSNAVLTNGYSGWSFWANNFRNTPNYDFGEFEIDKLFIDGRRIGIIFGSEENILGIETLYDLLSALCFSLFMRTGMIDKKRSFITSLFQYDENNLQTLGTILDVVKKVNTISVDSVKVNSKEIFRQDQRTNRYQTYHSYFSIAPKDATVEKGTNIEKEFILGHGRAVDVAGTYETAKAIETSIIDLEHSKTYPYVYPISKWLINYDKDQLDNGNWNSILWSIDEIIATYWYQLRNTKGLSRIDEFTLDGIDYDYLKNFYYDGHGYQIVSMRKNYDKNQTTIQAITIKEIAGSDADTDTGINPNILQGILEGGHYKNYTFIQPIVSANMTGDQSILNINASQKVETVTIFIPTYLEGGVYKTGLENITSVSVGDNDGTYRLGGSDTIKWKAGDDPLGPEGIENIIYVEKNYTSQQTIKVSFIGSAAENAAMEVTVKYLGKL